MNSCQSASQGAGGAESVNACNGNVDGGGDGDGNVNSCQTASQGDITVVNVPPPMGGQSTAISGKRFAETEEQGTLPDDPASKMIGILDLPAGSYALSAIVGFGTRDPRAACDLIAGDDIDTTSTDTDANGGGSPVNVTLPLAVVHTFAAPGQAIVSCTDQQADPDRPNSNWASVRIVAIQVGSTQTVPLSGE